MSPELIGQQLLSAGKPEKPLKVSLSHELVTLLSEQLYQSPMKAIEEMVVNCFDADAGVCRLSIPRNLKPGSAEPIVVYDDGIGMDESGLMDLWHIGHSHKREEQIEKARKRKQIGKFGIGKLATYSIARRITYITRVEDGDILTTSLDFEAFQPDPVGVAATPVELQVSKLTAAEFVGTTGVAEALEAAGAPAEPFADKASGTIVLLEDFKDRAQEMNRGVLRWVLSTAMPLSSDFSLYLGGEPVESSMSKLDRVVSFEVHELDENRRKNLSEQSGETWTVAGEALKSPLFLSGVSGEVMITDRTLMDGKSSDLQRSHGFFVRVRGRLVSLEDPLFGLNPVSHKYFNRFHADVRADDLDQGLTAPREGVEISSKLRESFERLLSELFNQARVRFNEALEKRSEVEKKKHEVDRNYVNPSFVEHPTADVLSGGGGDPAEGADADSTWFYLKTPEEKDLPALLDDLYAERREGVYSYERTQLGGSGRLVRFDPARRLFEINEEHEFARAHDDEDSALLEDIVTAEALLEVYLREEGVSAGQVGEILERRDQLLRSLALDRVYSVALIAQELRDAIADADDLEIAQVTACRALGFVAKHVKDSGKPDGVARFIDYPGEETTITLEAKSSDKTPSLPTLDFAGLAQHYHDYDAVGCLLIAPSYPGGSKGERSEAAKRAEKQKVSCWTVDQLADVVMAAESRHIGARQVLEIVRSKFSPDDVTAAIEELLSEPQYSRRELYVAIISAFRDLDGKLQDRPRTIDLIASNVAQQPEFESVTGEDLERAIIELGAASKGALIVSDQRLTLNTSVDELETRIASLLGTAGKPRRDGTMHPPTTQG
jgi:hypothetical protein